MAQLPSAFDTRTAPPPREDFDVLPSGEYTALIIDSKMKPTKSGQGQYLELTFQVMDDAYKGRNLWENLNLDNPNAKAVEIAQRDLSSICAAVGHVGPLADSIALHNKPLIVRVAIEPAGTKRKDGSVTSKDRNIIAAYKAIAGTTTAATAPATTPATGKAPWNRAA